MSSVITKNGQRVFKINVRHDLSADCPDNGEADVYEFALRGTEQSIILFSQWVKTEPTPFSGRQCVALDRYDVG